MTAEEECNNAMYLLPVTHPLVSCTEFYSQIQNLKLSYFYKFFTRHQMENDLKPKVRANDSTLSMNMNTNTKLTYMLFMSAPWSSKNNELSLSPLLTALCSNVSPFAVCCSILAPASRSLWAIDICPVHRASSNGVWSSLSDRLKSGTIGRRPPRPRLPATRSR